MNAITDEVNRVDPEEWERPDMRSALAVRDISRVYRLLQQIGFSLQQLAALTGQSQPEVSAILRGRRVMAYDVLAHIASGLGIPREYLGMSFGPMTVRPGVKPRARPRPLTHTPGVRPTGGTSGGAKRSSQKT